MTFKMTEIARSNKISNFCSLELLLLAQLNAQFLLQIISGKVFLANFITRILFYY